MIKAVTYVCDTRNRNQDLLLASRWLMIDHATTYSEGAIIHSKQKEVIIDKMFKHWISIFGTPKLFLSDNGGEFNNDTFH